MKEIKAYANNDLKKDELFFHAEVSDTGIINIIFDFNDHYFRNFTRVIDGSFEKKYVKNGSREISILKIPEESTIIDRINFYIKLMEDTFATTVVVETV